MGISMIWPSDLSEETLIKYGYVVQLIAGADGQLTLAERELFYAEARSRGIAEAVLIKWRAFEWRSGNLESLLEELKPLLTAKLARLLVYDAIRTAMADATYPLQEQDAVREAAEILGFDEKLVVELEVLASLEKNVESLKKALLFG